MPSSSSRAYSTPGPAGKSRQQPSSSRLQHSLFTFSTPVAAPPPSTQPSAADNEAAELLQYQQEQDWRWACSIAKADGRDPPPKPARVTPARIIKSTPRVKSSRQGGVVNELGAQATEVWKKKVPMGARQHKQAVQANDEARTAELIEETCRSAEAQEQQASLEQYRRRVGLVEESWSPSPALPIQRTHSLKRGSLTSKRGASSKLDLQHALQTAKRTMAQPAPSSATFEYDKIRAEIDAVGRRAEDELEGTAPRRRLFPTALTSAQQAAVTANFNDKSWRLSMEGVLVENKDLTRLRGLTWLNDEVITFYSVLLNTRSAEAVKARAEGKEDLKEKGDKLLDVHVYNSFFYKMYSEGGHKKVQRWSRKFDTFAKDKIIVPINLGNQHWVCAAINIKEKRFEYYDSLGNANNKVYATLRKYLEDEHLQKKKTPIDLSEWVNYWDDDVPQQNNACDCGIFTCQFMECLSRDVEGFDFKQKQMPYFRNKMALEMHEKRLIPEEEWGAAE